MVGLDVVIGLATVDLKYIHFAFCHLVLMRPHHQVTSPSLVISPCLPQTLPSPPWTPRRQVGSTKSTVPTFTRASSRCRWYSHVEMTMNKSVKLFKEDQGSIALTNNPEFYKLNISHSWMHFVREKVEGNQVHLITRHASRHNDKVDCRLTIWLSLCKLGIEDVAAVEVNWTAADKHLDRLSCAQAATQELNAKPMQNLL